MFPLAQCILTWERPPSSFIFCCIWLFSPTMIFLQKRRRLYHVYRTASRTSRGMPGFRMRLAQVSRNLTKLLDIKSLKLLDNYAQFNPSPLSMKQVWSLSSFEGSRQLLTNDFNQVSSVSLHIHSSTAVAKKGLFEMTRRPSLTRAVLLPLAETTEEPG